MSYNRYLIQSRHGSWNDGRDNSIKSAGDFLRDYQFFENGQWVSASENKKTEAVSL